MSRFYDENSIGKASKLLGVTRETLRRWEAEGKIKSERTPKGHRRYYKSNLLGLVKKSDKDKITIAYGRVSSHDQKNDLVRQIELLESYCTSYGWNYEVIKDLVSCLNYNKKDLL